ncbi:MAG: hypothetical protein WEC81_00405 [Patescibacteria group bacterium]
MAKKNSKNIQKLLKKRHLQALQEGRISEPTPTPPTISTVESPRPEIAAPSQLPALPSPESRPALANKLLAIRGLSPIIKTLISVLIIAVILIAVTISAGKSDYLTKFGDWLYTTLGLNN